MKQQWQSFQRGLAGLIFWGLTSTATAAPIMVSTDGLALAYCYDQIAGDSHVRLKTSLFSTANADGLLTLWRVQERNAQCDFTHAGATKAEPLFFGLLSYQFSLRPNAVNPKAVDIQLQSVGMNEPFKTTIHLRNL